MPSLNRRHFTFLGAATAAAAIAPRARPAASPNGMLHHASVGVNGMGWSDLNSLASHPKFKLVAAVDVDQANLDRLKADERFRDTRTYRDWREMLTAEGDRVDSVNIATPDHMHAVIALSAMQRRKHVYGQKPLAQTVFESRQMREFADKHGVVTQMGNQIHSHIAYRMAVAWLKAGAIGKIREVHSWIGAHFPQGPRPGGEDPVPAGLDWDLWLGVAPRRPFKQGLYHPFNWRGWQDFGGGGLGDFGCHIWDPPFTALGLTAPLTLRAEVPEEWANHPQRFRESWPDWEIIRAVFPGTPLTERDTVPLTWYDGGKKPDRALVRMPAERNLPDGGSLFIGTEGEMVLPHVNGPQLYPEDKFKGFPKPDIEKNVDHYHTFLDHVFTGKRTSDGFHYAGPLSEATQLGNIANRFPGEELKWDAAAFTLTGPKGAADLLRRPYRDGWGVV